MGDIRKRKNKNGTTSYLARVRKVGGQADCATFRKVTEARQWIRETEQVISDGKFFPTKASRKHTMAEAIDRFFEASTHKGSGDRKKKEQRLKWWKEQTGYRVLRSVTPAVLSEIKSEFLKDHQTSTWNRYHSALSSVFKKCMEWEWIDSNPLKRVSRETEPAGRVRFLSDDERDDLLQAAKEHPCPNIYLVVLLALSTGMRRGEIKFLEWGQVDLKAGIIQLELTKNKERRRVSVPSIVLGLLREHSKIRRIDNDYVFPSMTKVGRPFDLDQSWKGVRNEAKLEDFRFHDLRHSCASYLAMNGASLIEIAEVLGHKTMQMVKRYSHLAESHTASVVERVSLKVLENV